jgi:hypothetical protein
VDLVFISSIFNRLHWHEYDIEELTLAEQPCNGLVLRTQNALNNAKSQSGHHIESIS